MRMTCRLFTLIATLMMPVMGWSDSLPPANTGNPCIASTWGNTIALLDQAGVETFVYPDQQYRLYAKTPTENYHPDNAKYGVTVHQDCSISLRAHANGKWVQVAGQPDLTTAGSLAATANKVGGSARFSVAANPDGTYALHPVGLHPMNVSIVPFAEAVAETPVLTQKPTLTRAIIRGSRTQPDVVEERLRTLEQAGQLHIVRVLESWPLQFEVEAPADIIGQLPSGGF